MLRRIEARNDLEQFILPCQSKRLGEKGDTNAESAIRDARDWLEDHEEATLRARGQEAHAGAHVQHPVA
ncbi:hypothetical protein PInf_018245 [Phytophthora infestans]|nr:hypothetical protein PInf_018245 [Phytophthora infestans]